MSRLTAAAVATAATLVATACITAPSFAAGGASGGITFAGQCQFTGTSTFSSTVTLVPSPARNNVTASGSCSGSLTSHSGKTTQLSNSPVQYLASEFGTEESCNSNPNATGSGELVFQQGAVHFKVVENRVGGQAALAFSGRDGGSATGAAYVSSSDPAGLLEQCATSGITSAPVQIVFETTPSISG